MKNILALISLLFVALLSYSQSTPIDLRNISAHLPSKAILGNEKLNNGSSYRPIQKTKKPQSIYSKNGDICETVIGTSTYDLQTNASVANRMVLNDNGMSAVWTFSDENSTSYSDRGSGYNYQDGADWGSLPTERIESVRIGWPNVCVTGGGKEFVISHTFLSTGGLHIASRDVQGNGVWLESTMESTVGQVWPRVTSGGTDNNSIHIVSISMPVANGGALYNGLDGALLYYRSQDQGETWDQVEIQIPGTTEEFVGFGPDAYSISANGDKVAIAVFGDFYDSFVLISEDNGDTWTKTVLVDFPVDSYVVDTGIDLDMDGAADTLNNSDGSGTVLVDYLGNTHVFYGDMRYLDADLGDGNFSYFPFTSGIWYWNETLSEPIEIVDEIDTDGDPDVLGYDDLGLYFNSITGFVNASTDAAGNIHLAFSSLNESVSNGLQNYRHINLISSSDNGATWSNPLDITPDLDGDETIECVYPTMAPFANDRIQLWYQRDFEPGGIVQGDQDPIELQEIVHLDINPAITVSLSEPELNIGLEIYPNPVNGELRINADFRDISELNLFLVDMNGKLLLSEQMKSSFYSIDLSSKGAGAYFLIFESAGKIMTEKLIIE